MSGIGRVDVARSVSLVTSATASARCPMPARPALINCPFVVAPPCVRLCRQSERVLDILPASQRGPFAKEDGDAVFDAQGRKASE